MKRIFLLTIIIVTFFGGTKAQNWKTYADSAKYYQDKRQNNNAISFYQKAIIELKRDSLGTASYTSCCHRLAFLYFGMGKHDLAGPLLEEVRQLRIKLVGKEHIDFARSSGNLGLYYVVTGKYSEAESLMLEAKDLTQKIFGKEHTEYTNLTNNLGMLYKEWGKHERAELFYLEALGLREKVFGKEHLEYANSCNNLGGLYSAMGYYEKAEPLYTEAAEIRRKVLGKEHPDYAASLNNLAILRRTMGRYAEAEDLYIQAMDIRKKTLGDEHPDYAASLNNLAILYWATGNYEKVEPLHLEAIRIREKIYGKNSPAYTNSANNLATFYKDMGQYDKAEKLYLETNSFRAEMLGQSHPEYAMSVNNLAILYMQQNRYDEAEPLFLAAKRAREVSLGKEHYDYANSCDNLGILYAKTGKYDQAKSLLQEGNEVFAKLLGRSHPDFAGSLENIAGLSSDMGDFSTAEKLYLETRPIWISSFGKASESYITNSNNLAVVYWGLNQPERAYDFFKDAMAAREENLRKVFHFTTAKEQLAYLKLWGEGGEKALSFSSTAYPDTLQELAYDLILSNRNLVLSSEKLLRQGSSATTDTTISRKYADWLKAREQLAYWMSKPIDERNGRDTLYEMKANSLEQELARFSAAFREQPATSWKDIRNNLKADEATIEFAAFQYCGPKGWMDSVYYVALVIRKDFDQPHIVPLCNAVELDLETAHKAFSPGPVTINTLYKNDDKNGTASSRLYDLIWQPIEKKLSGIETVYFAPAGSLYKIAFAALPVQEGLTISDKYRLVQLTSTALSIHHSPATMKATDEVVLFGGVSYDADSANMTSMAIRSGNRTSPSRSVPEDLLRNSNRGFEYLAGTQQEIMDIGKLSKQKKYRVEVLNNMSANEESFKSLSGSASPSILHIATHGFFFPDPASIKSGKKTSNVFQSSNDPLIRSGLALAGANNAWKGKPIAGVEDGILTAYEVSNMYLPNTKLAVLSACETGLGDIQGSEGVYGLQRAFKMAGVENLVMSLWKVPDQETAEFMQHFYKNLFAKQSIQDAFYSTQKIMRNKYRDEPYKWAAWVLIR